MRRHSLAGAIAGYIVLVVAALLSLFPLFWVFLTSLKNPGDAQASAARAFDFQATGANYAQLFGDPVFRGALLTSTTITVVSTLIVVVIATLGGYAFARLRFLGRRVLAVVMVCVQIIPAIVLVIPLYQLVSQIGLYDQWLPIMLILATLCIPFATWVTMAFFQSMPVEVEEAAVIDGTTRIQLFRYVLLPMVAPGIATAAIFTAIGVWNSFLIPLILGQARAETLTVYAAQFITFQEVNWGPLSAAAVLIFAPIVLFVLLMQRALVRGLTAGSVK
jgi:ABC-type glycerol-3-phosphate transport system permease component